MKYRSVHGRPFDAETKFKFDYRPRPWWVIISKLEALYVRFVLAVLASEGTISGSSLVVPLMALRGRYIIRRTVKADNIRLHIMNY